MKKETSKLENVYVCLTVFHLYVSLLNIFNNSSKSKSLLILTDDIVDVDKIADSIKVVIPEIEVVLVDNKISRNKIISNVKNKIFFYKYLTKYYCWFLDKYDFTLKDTNINIFNDTEYFSRFLLKRYKHFILWEDGVWMHPIIQKDLKYYLKHYLFQIPKKFGTSSSIKRIMVQDISRLPKDIRYKGLIYDLKKMSNNLDIVSKEKIQEVFLNGFGIDNFVNNKKKMIILTQPISEENYVSEIQKVEIYIKLIQKYNSNNEHEVYIKNHPRDLTDYTKYYEKAIIIPHNIPFEIFSLNSIISFDLGITLWSSSIYNVSFIKEKIFLGTDYIKDISMRKDF